MEQIITQYGRRRFIQRAAMTALGAAMFLTVARGAELNPELQKAFDDVMEVYETLDDYKLKNGDYIPTNQLAEMTGIVLNNDLNSTIDTYIGISGSSIPTNQVPLMTELIIKYNKAAIDTYNELKRKVLEKSFPIPENHFVELTEIILNDEFDNTINTYIGLSGSSIPINQVPLITKLIVKYNKKAIDAYNDLKRKELDNGDYIPTNQLVEMTELILNASILLEDALYYYNILNRSSFPKDQLPIMTRLVIKGQREPIEIYKKLDEYELVNGHFIPTNQLAVMTDIIFNNYFAK